MGRVRSTKRVLLDLIWNSRAPANVRVDALESLHALGLIQKDRVLLECRKLAGCGRIRHKALRRLVKLIADLQSATGCPKLDKPEPLTVGDELKALRIAAQSGEGSLDAICARLKRISRDKQVSEAHREIARQLRESLL